MKTAHKLVKTTILKRNVMQKLITIKHYFLYNVSRKGIAVFFQQKRTESFVYYRQLRKILPRRKYWKKCIVLSVVFSYWIILIEK